MIPEFSSQPTQTGPRFSALPPFLLSVVSFRAGSGEGKGLGRAHPAPVGCTRRRARWEGAALCTCSRSGVQLGKGKSRVMVLKPQLAELAPEPKPFSSKSIIYSLPEVRFQCHKHGVKLRAAGFVCGHWHSEQCASSQLAAPDLRRVRSRYPRFIKKDSGDQNVDLPGAGRSARRCQSRCKPQSPGAAAALSSRAAREVKALICLDSRARSTFDNFLLVR